jgi:surface antigen
MKMKLISFLTVVTMFLVACDGNMPSKQAIGGVLGGVAGGVAGDVLGGSTITIVAGTLLGAALGTMVGRSMDQGDLYRTSNALDTGRTTSWVNSNTQNQYKVIPSNTYRNASGQNCRNYTTVGIIDGQREVIKGTACRQADGSWKSQ